MESQEVLWDSKIESRRWSSMFVTQGNVAHDQRVGRFCTKTMRLHIYKRNLWNLINTIMCVLILINHLLFLSYSSFSPHL